ncbi:MAG TPA: hypothetical protein VKZ18_11735 [Polyangia bacterium]|nr:hypothetical protein [Polyangia bacterium]
MRAPSPAKSKADTRAERRAGTAIRGIYRWNFDGTLSDPGRSRRQRKALAELRSASFVHRGMDPAAAFFARITADPAGVVTALLIGATFANLQGLGSVRDDAIEAAADLLIELGSRSTAAPGATPLPRRISRA